MLTLNGIAGMVLRSAIVAFVLTAVALGALFASQPAAAEEKKPVLTQTTNDTNGIQRSKTRSADRNAEAVRALL